MPEQDADLFHAGDAFSAVELQAMRIDGLLQRVCGDSYIPVGQPCGPAARAKASVHRLPDVLRSRVAVARYSAAWVYGCASLPPVLHLATDHRKRTTALPPHSRAVMHQVALGPRDLLNLGGIAVTTPLRTALDIAVHGEERSAVAILGRLSADAALACPLGLVAAALRAAHRVPGKAAGLRRLEDAMRVAGTGT